MRYMPDLQPLHQPPLLSQSVELALRNYILDNSLKPGSALPSENDLAQQLGVSRNAVREAVKALGSLGIVEPRRGSGLYVGNFSLVTLVENLPYGLLSNLQELIDLLEIREILEIAMVDDMLAAFDQIQGEKLRAVLDEMSEKATQGLAFPDEDRLFHRTLFENLGNKTLLKLMDIFWLTFYRAAKQADIADPSPQGTYQDHLKVLEAIESNQPEEVRKCLSKSYDGLKGRVARIKSN